ncbi:hypothetical protein [Aeromonas piscicola]|uniref:hypothetical protein n=1 Tax=Aeromonas piscicola TaxID=600645 RepID=UPI0021F818F0|nr:hypothetical protein [Aeromonas piscicola]MCW0507850.1 hypothetical protein [Aeromonas piscicola]
MHNRKIDSLKEFVSINDFISLSFEDILSWPNANEVISDLIFLVGYNYIEHECNSNGFNIFKAGMFYNEMDEKLTLSESGLEGKLLLAVKTAFNVYIDIQKQSNVMDLYSPDMRESIAADIIKKNKIDLFFFNQIQKRIIC